MHMPTTMTSTTQSCTTQQESNEYITDRKLFPAIKDKLNSSQIVTGSSGEEEMSPRKGGDKMQSAYEVYYAQGQKEHTSKTMIKEWIV